MPEVSSDLFFSHLRLDLGSRIPLAREMLAGQVSPYALWLYESFIRAYEFAGYGEDGQKFSFADYLVAFGQLVRSMQSNGYQGEGVPTTHGRSGLLLTNGAHRVVVSQQLGISVPYVSQPQAIASSYSASDLRKAGVPQQTLELFAFEILEALPTTRALVLMGKAIKESKSVASELGDRLLFVKRIELDALGFQNLIWLCYGANEWWRPDLLEKMCIERGGTRAAQEVVICWYKGEDESSNRALKERIRRKVLGRTGFERTIHGTDEYSDTSDLSNILLTPGGLRALHQGQLALRFDSLHRRIQSECGDLNLGSDDWAITGSSLLELFGIREARDVDFIGSPPIPDLGDTANSNDLIQNEGLRPEQLATDPRSSFRLRGVRFLSLDTLLHLKLSRGTQKDLEDLVLAKGLENSVKIEFSTQGPSRILKLRILASRAYEMLLGLLPEPVRPKLRRLARFVGGLFFSR